MEFAIPKDEVVRALWGEYKKTKEYKSGQSEAIPANFPLVINREKDGSRSIVKDFVENLDRSGNKKEEFISRNLGEWHKEWKRMHAVLFSRILINTGEFRAKPVRFGSPGDEERYRIPPPEKVSFEMSIIAKNISDGLKVDYKDLAEKCSFLAKIHYEFIRVHPFPDGNGRIARALTDQLAIVLGMPPAVAGYPRHDNKARKYYHHAIESCIEDPSCTGLADWIRGFIETQVRTIA